MTSHPPRTDCPDEEFFTRMLEGQLNAQEDAHLHEHLDRCESCASLVADLAHVLYPKHDGLPERIGRYVVRRQVGAGGMGVVYEAWDGQLQRKVAIKLMRDGLVDEDEREEYAARLLREAQMLAAITHPHVLTVHDVGTWEGQVFMATQFVSGHSMSGWIEHKDPPWHKIVGLYVQAARGVAAAHRRGLIHRDLKPENLLVDEDERPWVADFGLARSLSAPVQVFHGPMDEALRSDELAVSALTRSGALVGTPLYMAPEQHDGQPADARSDQFALCASLYESIYRRLPYSGRTLGQLAAQKRAGEIVEQIPSPIYEVLRRGLSPAPIARYPSMEALANALEQALSAPAPSATRWVPSLLAAAAVLITLATALALRGPTPAPSPAPAPSALSPSATPPITSARSPQPTTSPGASAPPSWIVADEDRRACLDGADTTCATLATRLLRHYAPGDDDSPRRASMEALDRDTRGLSAAMQRACEANHATPCTLRAFMLLARERTTSPQGPDIPAYAELMRRGCALYEPRACHEVGNILCDGDYDAEAGFAIPADAAQCATLMEAACSHQRASVCVALAERFYSPWGKHRRDIPRAMELLSAACAQGMTWACVTAGVAWTPHASVDACAASIDKKLWMMRDNPILDSTLSPRQIRQFCTQTALMRDETRARELLKRGCETPDPVANTNRATDRVACALLRGEPLPTTSVEF